MKQISTIIFSSLLLLVISTAQAYGIDFNRYHNQKEIAAYLRSAAKDHPDVARFEVLGQSQQGREIASVTISKNWSPDTPSIYFNGTHHGNERASTEAVLGFIEKLLANQDQPAVDRLLKRYRIILQPLVNPDGHALNLRTDSKGIDPNRDYATPTRDERDAFQLVETRIVKRILEKERVVASAAFHSGLEAVLWPWCHTPTTSQHDPVFRRLAGRVANKMQLQKARQSFYDYKTDGEYIDFAYMRYGIYALTFEVDHEAAPTVRRLPAVVHRSAMGSLAFLNAVDDILNQQKSDPAAALEAKLQSSL
jgi:predicted deacylase